MIKILLSNKKKEIDPIPNEKTKYFFETIEYKKNRRIR